MTIAYPGNGLPRVIDLPKSRQLVEKIRRTVPGATVVDAGGGGGTFDLFVATSDAAEGRQAIERAAAELRLHNDVFMEAFPAVCLEALGLARPAPGR